MANSPMNPNELISQLIDAICDGRDINWDNVQMMLDSSEHHLIPHLRLLHHIMQFHMQELDDDVVDSQ